MDFDCDTFMPPINEEQFKLVDDPNIPSGTHEEDGLQWVYEKWERLASWIRKKPQNPVTHAYFDPFYDR